MPDIFANFLAGQRTQRVLSAVKEHIGHVHNKAAGGVAGLENQVELLQQFGAKFFAVAYGILCFTSDEAALARLRSESASAEACAFLASSACWSEEAAAARLRSASASAEACAFLASTACWSELLQPLDCGQRRLRHWLERLVLVGQLLRLRASFGRIRCGRELRQSWWLRLLFSRGRPRCVRGGRRRSPR